MSMHAGRAGGLLGIGLLVDLVASERWLDVLLLILLVVLFGCSYALSRYARRTLLYQRSGQSRRES